MSYITVTVERMTRHIRIQNTEILMNGDTLVPIRLYFTDDSERVRQDESEDEFIIFEIKQRGQYTADALASCEDFTRGDTDDDPYTGTFDLTDSAIATLIAGADLLLCMGGVTWKEGGGVRSSQVAPFRIGNVVVTPTGTTPDFFTYLRSGGFSIFRPDGTSVYARP